MNDIEILIGDTRFSGELQDGLAPATCRAFRELLPWSERIIHVRWSGEGCWIPLGDRQLGVGFENATSYPEPGQFLFYPGGVSETEILVAYGPAQFASKAGQLAGNPFLRIVDNLDGLAQIGRRTLWEGALPIEFRLV